MCNEVWIEQRQVIAIHPVCPCTSVEVKRIKVTGQWETAACDWARRVPSPDVQSRIVLAKEFIRTVPETVRIILQRHKQVWGAFQKSLTFSKVNAIFYQTRLGPFSLLFSLFYTEFIYYLVF